MSRTDLCVLDAVRGEDYLNGMDQSDPILPRVKPTQGECGAVPELMGHIGDKWTILVMGNLAHGPLRYKQLQREIHGISQRMLTLTLKSLEADGLVSRTVYPTVPPRVDYELTQLGWTLTLALAPLHKWVNAHRNDILAAREAYARRSAD